MDILMYLIPIAISLGCLWLWGFFWSLKNNQFDDPEGNAQRILRDDEPAQTNPDSTSDR